MGGSRQAIWVDEVIFVSSNYDNDTNSIANSRLNDFYM